MLYVNSMIYTDLLWYGLLLWVVLSLADSLISNCKVFWSQRFLILCSVALKRCWNILDIRT